MGLNVWKSVAAGAILGTATATAGATQVSGSLGGVGSLNDEVRISFTCTLEGTTCTGVAALRDLPRECSNWEDTSGAITITGLDLTSAHALQGEVAITHPSSSSQPNASRICAYIPRPVRTDTFPYSGQWDGIGRGTLLVEGTDDDNGTFRWTGTFTADIPAAAAVFPMTVKGAITPTVADIRADIGFRPQDIGQAASIYVFALAPASLARPLAAENQPAAAAPKADTPVACVLAQLNGSGQLQQVSASGMQAFVTEVLTSQGKAVTVLGGVPTVQIAGATFYIGYGASASAMLASGVNRSVVTAPAPQTCQPQPPQTGWWWNPAQGGRGFSLEVRGSTIFFASYLYDAAGHPVWLAASGLTSLDGSLFTGRLLGFSGGQTLDGPWRVRGPALDNGAVTLAFNDANHGTLVWPGGSIAIERYEFVSRGATLPAQAGQPESGWWWNPQEDGRGFFLEWQGGSAFVAGYMYDASGLPIWYASQAATPNATQFQGNWSQYANGQTLTGPYQPAVAANANVAPVAITFQGRDTAVMALPGGRTTTLVRFRF